MGLKLEGPEYMSWKTPYPLEWFQGAQESGAESQRGTWVLWVCATQGNDLGSPRCCSDEERSKTVWGHKQHLQEFLYMH